MSEAVKSAERALKILELLTGHESALAFTEIAERLDYPRSSLHGLLRTLTASGWLEFDERTRRYALGIRTLEAGNAYTRSRGLVERASATMERIRDELDETVQLAVLDGRHNVYVAKFDGGHALTLASEVGRRLPAHATGIGKVLLAGLSDDELGRRLSGVRLERYTPSTITDLDALRDALRIVRDSGHGTDDEEYTVGVRCVAVPVRDHTGHVVAGLSASVPTIRFDEGFRDRALELLRSGASDISRSLGHAGSSSSS